MVVSYQCPCVADDNDNDLRIVQQDQYSDEDHACSLDARKAWNIVCASCDEVTARSTYVLSIPGKYSS